MRNSGLIIIIIILFNACISKPKAYDFEIQTLPKKREAMQKRIIGQLSGKNELTPNLKLNARWTPQERHLSRYYLKQIIAQLGLKANENSYQQANINAGVDFLFEPYKGGNIYTILPAIQKSDSYIILGAHYDTGKRNAPGAIDNATGVTLIYSVLKGLQKLTYRNQNVIMVFFDQEEEENVGSVEFIKLIRKNKWKISSVHCFDMVGWDSNQDDAMQFYTISKSLQKKYLAIAKSMNKKVFDFLFDPIGYENNSTDFDEFAKEKFNVIGAGECTYGEDTSPYKDTVDDTFETVNFEYLLSSTQFIETVLMNLLKEGNHEY